MNNKINKSAKIAKDVTLTIPVTLLGNVDIKSKCKIDAFTFINSNTIIKRGTIIGKYCSIGKNCEIAAYDHPIDWLSTSVVSYNIATYFPDFKDTFKQHKVNRPKITTIGNDVWIGSLVIIKRGITIGDGAIVGGGAVVTKDVPPYAIVGGVPAKILKYRFNDTIINQLLKIKWWHLSYELLSKVDFNNITVAIKQLEQITKETNYKGNKLINFNYSVSKNYKEVQNQLSSLVQKELTDNQYTITHNEYDDKAINFTWFIMQKTDVLMSHGVADKNYYWRKNEEGERIVNSLKAVLVQGEWMKKRMIKSKYITLLEDQIIVCGWPRLDLLRKLQSKIELKSPKEEIKLLWAPTHDLKKRADGESTSTFPKFQKYTDDLQTRYIYKESLHPRNRKDKEPTLDKLLNSNVVISDFGTLVYEAWSLGKPVIFPRWILKDRIQKYTGNSAEAYIFEKSIGYHPNSYEEMIEILESGPVITKDVDEFMEIYLDNYKGGNSSKKTAEALEMISLKYEKKIIEI